MIPVNLLYVSDAKAGHRSQALGLYTAYQRLYPQQLTQWTEINIDQLAYWDLCLHKKVLDFYPNYIIGVGSHTHFKVWLLSKIYPQAKTIILMKTHLPFSWFDYHIIPQHDGQFRQSNVILTQGVLNPIINQQKHQAKRMLVALGGSSKRHQWQDKEILNQLSTLIKTYPDYQIVITTSRRTPNLFLNQLLELFPINQYTHLKICPVEQTAQGWIFEQMQLAEVVWVTEDSVSMIYEALSSGAKVGILSVQRIKSDRITLLLDQFMALPQPFTLQLNEADRVVKLIF